MKNLLYPAMALGLAWALFLASLAYASAQLPERVASHFGLSGQADGWMSRSAYLLSTAAIGFGLPLLVVTLCIAIPFLPPGFVRLPDKAYRLAPENRPATSRYLGRHSLWLAALMVVFMTGMNLLTVLAHRQPAPHLSNPLMFTLIGACMIGTVVWTVALCRGLRAPTPLGP